MALWDDTDDDQIDIDPGKDYLNELVGEGKKFKSPEDLAKGKYLADKYIETLTRQRDEMREDYLKLDAEYKARAKLEDLIDQLQNNQPQGNNNNPGASEDNTRQQQPDFDSLFDAKFQAKELERKQQANEKLVRDTLQEKLGPHFKQILKQKMENLGLTESFVKDLAQNHPQVLFKTLELDNKPQEQFQPPIRSTQARSDNFVPAGGQKRTWSWYQNLKKSDPKTYHDPKTTVQMHQDAIALGEAFKDGDYHLV